MISFSESQEYVDRTGTIAPMAGYLSWYDEAVRFDCGFGDGSVSLTNLPPSPWTDVMFFNFGDTVETVRWTGTTTSGAVDSLDVVVNPNDIAYYANSSFEESELGSFSFSTGTDQLSWAVVVYDHPHSVDRIPWGGRGRLAEGRSPLLFRGDGGQHVLAAGEVGGNDRGQDPDHG